MKIKKGTSFLGWILGFCFLFVVSSNLSAQQITISGEVVSASDGTTLPGVNILVKGTNRGTTTDANGSYEISASANDTLTFSYIGFATKNIPVQGRSTINVTLNPSTQALEEVVVTGYGTVNQRESTSSIVQVNEEDLGKVTAPDATSMIQGKVSGVYISHDTGRPGANPSINIRGTGSLSGGSEPLYVIDGVIAGNGMEGVTPSDIKSISVLKDAAATSLYGSRASGGVVVITTKSGVPGKTEVNVKATVGFSNQLKGNLELMNSQQLYDLHKMMNDPNLTPDLLNTDTNWREVLYQTAIRNKYEASVSGGNDQTTFYVAGNYYKEEGTVIQTHFDRIAGRANLSHKVSENFMIDAKVSGHYATDQNIAEGGHYNVLNFSYRLLPWDSPYNSDGTLRTGLESDWLSRDSENPLYPMQWNYDNGRHTNFLGNLKLTYDFTEWASFTSTNNFELENSNSEIYYDSRSQRGSANSGELYNSEEISSSIITSNLIHLNQDFGDHAIGGIAGFEYQRNDYQSTNLRGIGIPNGLHIQDVAAEALNVGGYKQNSVFVSFLSQVNYSYENKYNLSASFRRDGSSRFGENNRYGNFYSVGGSWVVSNEEFMNSESLIDQLKVRASYGTTGNAAIGPYEASGLYSFANQYGGITASIPERIPSPSLTWEVAYNTNVGIDIGLYERIDLSVDLYNRRNEDLLQQVRLPGTSGYEYRIQNVGTVRNRGVEFQVSSENILGEFNWTTDFNISFNNNKVLDLFEGTPILNGNQRIIEGRDLNTWYLRKWAGVDPQNGDPLWEKQTFDSNGNVTGTELTNNYDEANLQTVGTASPDFTGGIRNIFQYKGVSLSTFFNFVYGNEILYYNDLYDDGAYVSINNAVLQPDESRWQEPGDHATHPKPVYGGNQDSHKPSSRFLEDGSFLRLKNATLSYNLPSSLLQKVNIRSVRLYVSGDNVLTFTDYRGRDPEVSVNGGIGSNPGSVGEKYPSSRRILFGIELGL